MPSRSRTPYTILGCLSLEPMSGYAIKQFLDRTVVHFWNESYGQIYPTLQRLEEQGLAEGHEETGERGRTRRVYRITKAGREALEQWLQQPAEPVTPRYEHSLKLFFGHNVGAEVSLEHVKRLRRQTTQALSSYRDGEEELRSRAARAPESQAPYWLAVLRGGIHYSNAVLAWCDETEALLRGLGAPEEPRAAASEQDDERDGHGVDG